MLKRLSFTLTVTAGLTGLYWLYALVVTPRLEPPLEHERLRSNQTMENEK